VNEKTPRASLLDRLKARPREVFVRTACYLSIGSMLMMVWSVLDPRPLPVLMAMSVGQAGALLAFVMFLVAVLIPHAHAEPQDPLD